MHRWYSPKWVVRSNASPARLAPKIQAEVAAVDPELPVSGFRTMDEVGGIYLQQQRYTTALFSMMAALALALAAIGLYGLISNAIAQRMHELGVRMALGATAAQIIAATVRPGILLALAGIAAGALSGARRRALARFDAVGRSTRRSDHVHGYRSRIAAGRRGGEPDSVPAHSASRSGAHASRGITLSVRFPNCAPFRMPTAALPASSGNPAKRAARVRASNSLLPAHSSH